MIAQVDDYRQMHNARTYDAEATHTMSWLLNRVEVLNLWSVN